MNINPFKHIISHLRSRPTDALPSHNATKLQHLVEAYVTHIKQVVQPQSLTTQGNQTALEQFIVTVNTGSKPMDILTDLPLTIGETLTLATDSMGRLHLINRSQPPQLEHIRALIADLANRQDSLIPLLKTLAAIMNSTVMKSLSQLTPIQTLLQQPLSEGQLRALAATILKLDTATPAVPSNVESDSLISTTNTAFADSVKASAELFHTPRWPDLAATVMALHQSQTRLLTDLNATNLEALIRDLSTGTSLTLAQQAVATSHKQGLTHTFTSLLFRLVALLEVTSAESAAYKHSEPPGISWYTAWHALHPKGWAPSLPEADAPHLPWLPPVTQLHPILPRSVSSETPTPNWLEGFIKVLMHQSAAAIARLTTHHLLHQQNRQDSSPTIIQMEIPMQWQGQWTQANLHMREDRSQQSHTEDKRATSRQWSLNLSFNLDHIGAIVVQFTLHNQISRGTVWVEKATTFNTAHGPFQRLLDTFETIGLQQRCWKLQQGLPPVQAPSVTTRLVDIKT